jgi:ribosome-binding protein aMBF1 (putative translation factor)
VGGNMYRNQAGWGGIFILGALIGAFLALMFGTDENGNTKKTVKVKVKATKDGMKEIKEQRIDPVIEIFEEKTKEAKEKFQLAMDDLSDKLVALKENIKNIDREKYMKIVDEVIADLKKSGNYTSTQLGKMKTYMANDYKEITAEVAKKSK